MKSRKPLPADQTESAQTGLRKPMQAQRDLSDRRSAALTQARLQSMADGSPRVLQQQALVAGISSGVPPILQRKEVAQLGRIKKTKKGAARKGKRKKFTPDHSLNSRARISRNAKLQGDFIERARIAPDSWVNFEVVVGNQIRNYASWLRHEPSWSWREPAIQLKRAEALKVLKSAESRHAKELDTLRKESGKNMLLSEWDRKKSLAFKLKFSEEIKNVTTKIHEELAKIDELVKEPPVPPKTWASFMGDARNYTYHSGDSSDPIPVVWYKSETNYKPIKTRKKGESASYSYPNGPTVRGRLGKYEITVDSEYRFKVGDVFRNRKKVETRTTQVDINHALKLAGVDLAGLDGDHVTDLGFGGVDKASNYWPLVANVNRRPFLGWRKNYGLNYKDGPNTFATTSIAGLYGKYLKIKAFMSEGDGNVPAEGVNPDHKAGSDTV